MRLAKLPSPRRYLSHDLVAGLTFAVVNIPTAMAHSLLASANPVAGVYTLMTAMPVAALFTSSIFMNVSTTSAIAVAAGSVISTYSSDQRAVALATLVVLVGIFELLFGLFRLGTLIRFVPHSVMVGFSNGVAILIILGQVSDLTGAESSYSNKIAQTMDILLNPSEIYFISLLLGVITFVLVVWLSTTRFRKVAAVIALIVVTLIPIIFSLTEVELVSSVATIPRSLPKPILPDLRMVFGLLIPAASVMIIGLVQAAGISQVYPNHGGKFSDVSRDSIGQGIGNVVAGFFQGIPAGGSMSGTALNVNSGMKSRWTNIFGGLSVVVIILLFAPLVGYIPMPALAALVMLAGFQSLQLPQIQTVYQTGWIPTIAMGLTFALTLLIPLQYAVLIGVSYSILLFVFRQSNNIRIVQLEPIEGGLAIEKSPPKHIPSDQVLILFFYGSLFFASSQAIEDGVPKPKDSSRSVVILGLRGHVDLGSTVITTLQRYARTLIKNNCKLVLAGVSPQTLAQLQRTGTIEILGEENVFLLTPIWGESVNKAVIAAHQWIDNEKSSALAQNTEL